MSFSIVERWGNRGSFKTCHWNYCHSNLGKVLKKEPNESRINGCGRVNTWTNSLYRIDATRQWGRWEIKADKGLYVFPFLL